MAKKRSSPKERSGSAGGKRALCPAKVLLLRLGEESPAGAQVRAILSGMDLPAVAVSPLEAGQTIGFLCGIAGFSQQQGTLPDPGAANTPFLLMAGLSEVQQNRLLTALGDAGVHIPLKAVLTETNQHWTLAQLLRELKREHAALRLAGNSDPVQPMLHLDQKDGTA